MYKILITGASGLLGSNLCRQYCQYNNVYGVFNSNHILLPLTTLFQCDLTSQQQMQKLKNITPDLIIHTAGEANVDQCENNMKSATQSILQATKNIVELAKLSKCHLIYLSTDALFSGESEYYSEFSTPNPINQYARLKIEAEDHIRNKYSKHSIIRTRFYGKSNKHNTFFTEQIIKKLKNNNTIHCFTDSYTTQIYIETLGNIFIELFKKRLFGTFNIVEDKKYSRYEFAKIVAKVFRLNSDLIIPSSFNDVNWETPRPIDTSLSNKKIKGMIETPILSTHEGLLRMKKNFNS